MKRLVLCLLLTGCGAALQEMAPRVAPEPVPPVQPAPVQKIVVPDPEVRRRLAELEQKASREAPEPLVRVIERVRDSGPLDALGTAVGAQKGQIEDLSAKAEKYADQARRALELAHDVQQLLANGQTVIQDAQDQMAAAKRAGATGAGAGLIGLILAMIAIFTKRRPPR